MRTRITLLAIAAFALGACGEQPAVSVDNVDSVNVSETESALIGNRYQRLTHSYCSSQLPWGVCSSQCTQACVELYCANTNVMGPTCGSINSWHFEAQWYKPGTFSLDSNDSSFTCNVVCNKCTACDFTGDKKVTFSDYLIQADNWNTSVTPYTNGDCTGNGYVDNSDLAQLDDYFGDTCPNGGNDAPGI